jgi:uncharacterized protein
MRLSQQQQEVIQHLVHGEVGADACVSVFGSRLDDSRRGGDLDLLIETSIGVPLLRKAALKQQLEQQLHMPVDILFIRAGETHSAFASMARARAQPLSEVSR